MSHLTTATTLSRFKFHFLSYLCLVLQTASLIDLMTEAPKKRIVTRAHKEKDREGKYPIPLTEKTNLSLQALCHCLRQLKELNRLTSWSLFSTVFNECADDIWVTLPSLAKMGAIVLTLEKNNLM